MAEKVAITKSKIVAVGDAIREKARTTEEYGLDEMPQAIRDIQGGGSDFTIDDSSYLFAGTARMENFDNIMKLLKDVTKTDHMFYYNYVRESIDLSDLDTSNVTDMSSMFEYCQYVPSINISNFNTSNVGNMARMFYYCDQLQEIDVSKLDVSKVLRMDYMFYGCNNLKSLDLSTWNTAALNQVQYMFSQCNKLETINLGHIDTSRCTNFQSMFYQTSLKNIDFSILDTSRVTNMGDIFGYCKSLEEVTGFSATNKAGLTITFPNGTANNTYPLKRLTFKTDLPEGVYSIRSAINIKYCSFDREGMVEMFNSLPDVSKLSHSANYKKITITGNPCVTDGTLTEEDKAIATAKGWTLVV